MSMKIAMGDESIQRDLFERIGVIFVMDEESFSGAVEYQGFRPSFGELMW